MKKKLNNGQIFETSYNYDKIVKSFNASVKWHHINNKYLGTPIAEKYLNYQLSSEQLYNKYNKLCK
jgi:hypothetical protein